MSEHKPEGWASIEVSPLSICLVGRGGPDIEPLGLGFTDRPAPGSLEMFGFIERAVFRALLESILSELDGIDEREAAR